MPKILAIYGSPRRNGNTSLLLKSAVQGAREAGASVAEVILRDLKMSPCLEIYGCKQTGRCVIQDDFQRIYDQIVQCEGLILASPIFFYTVSAHTKTLMDCCQSFWVKKYWRKESISTPSAVPRKGMFISAGATKGKKLFDGALLTIRYFFEPLDVVLWRTLLYRGLDFEGDVSKHPEYLEEAYAAGRDLCSALSGESAISPEP